MIKKILFILLLSPLFLFSQNSYQIAVLKYNGGGDWYANPTSLPNLVEFCNKNINTNIKREIATVEVGSLDVFNYPFLHMTGHGNVVFSAKEAENLRNYLLSGGFLHIDDNYGIDTGTFSTIHPVLSNEKLLDSRNVDFSIGRAAKNIKVTKTGVVKSLYALFPHMTGKLLENAISFRIPTDIVSVVQSTLITRKQIGLNQLEKKLGYEFSTQEGAKPLLG